MGHDLAMWALAGPLAWLQFNNAVQHVNAATSARTAGEACKATIEAYTASLLPHHVGASAQLACPQVFLEDSLGALRAPQARVPPHHPRWPPCPGPCTEHDFQAR